MRSLAVVLLGLIGMGASAADKASSVTFDKDVLPIFQKNCQYCHRPGEVAPMSLITYDAARPWAKAIKQAVLTRKMPPWFADPHFGHFANDRTLSERDIKTLTAWADTGALEGNAADKPAPVVFEEGWNLKPDIVVEMPKAFEIPAKGTINYKFILVKTNFPKDMWITAAEMRAGNSAVLHHGRVWVRPPGSHWMEKAVPGEAYEMQTQRDIIGRNTAMIEGNDILGKYNPGLGPQYFDVDGAAKFVPKGSDLVFEMHYTTIGKPESDISKVGLVVAKEPPKARYLFNAGPTALNLAIPAGDPHAEVVSEVTVNEPVTLVYVQPHMHLRGTDFEVRLAYPTGETETVIKAKWNFDWQVGYELAKPIPLPVGTRIIGIAHYDNSANNRYNPDPTKLVFFGPQNWDEMSNAFIGVVMDLKTDPAKVFRRSGPSLLPRGKSGPTMAALELTR